MPSLFSMSCSGRFGIGTTPDQVSRSIPERYVVKLWLRVAIGGNYAMALRFRRDSLAPLETTEWLQQVFPERDIKPPS